jgi:hypothetical protein
MAINSEPALPILTSMVDPDFEKDYAPQARAGAGSTEEGSDRTTTNEQYPLLLPSLNRLSQSVVSDVRIGRVSDDAMHMYLQMLAQALRENTLAYTVAVQHPSFWVVSEVISEVSKQFWRRLTDGHMVDMAVLRKVLIPRFHRDHWQLFVIERDVRMIKFYSPASRTVRINDREVGSTIDVRNLLLANRVVCRSS